MNNRRTRQISNVKRDEKLRILRNAREEEQRKKQEEEYKKVYREVYSNWLGRYIITAGIEHKTPESLMLKLHEEEISKEAL